MSKPLSETDNLKCKKANQTIGYTNINSLQNKIQFLKLLANNNVLD